MKQNARVSFLVILGIVGGITIAGHLPGAEAQSARVNPGNADDLRPVYATTVDVAEGRHVTETCSRCHGTNGISSTKGVPNVAGQRPAYLYAKLRAYQTGARKDHDMESAVKFLSDDALVKVAAYYASLDPAQPATTGSVKAVPSRSDPVQAGKTAAAGCAGCHGEVGISKTPGMPSLAGLDPKYLVAAMTAYKSGQRKNEIMKPMIAALSDADLKNIALYYGLQKPARAQTPAPGNQAAGKAAAAGCAGCHGDQGVSGNPATPSLAGQDAQYFASALREYKDGSRKEETMKGVAAALNDRAVNDLAAYYAAQQPQPPKVEKPLTTAEWVQRCDRCHGVSGNSTDPRTPALAAQRTDYLVKSLRAYQAGARKDSVMSAMSSSLTDTDIEALAAYYSRQRARAFVYVMVPGR